MELLVAKANFQGRWTIRLLTINRWWGKPWRIRKGIKRLPSRTPNFVNQLGASFITQLEAKLATMALGQITGAWVQPKECSAYVWTQTIRWNRLKPRTSRHQQWVGHRHQAHHNIQWTSNLVLAQTYQESAIKSYRWTEVWAHLDKKWSWVTQAQPICQIVN